MEFDEWGAALPDAFRSDAAWKIRAFRLALFGADLAWNDATRVSAHPLAQGLARQLVRAAASVHANIAEGSSRRSHLDRARFYEYALGSAREVMSWYHASRYVLDATTYRDRLELWEQVRRLLITMCADQRTRAQQARAGDTRDGSARSSPRRGAPLR